MSLILGLDEARPGTPVGGKARALADLSGAGFPIPPWFVVAPAAFWSSLPATDRDRLSAAATDVEVSAILGDFQPSADVRRAIAAAIEKHGLAGTPVAVRSSASDEDGARHSFAGQLESYLDVDPREVPERVADVWRSGFSRRILAYRRHHGLRLPPPVPAVLVQRMVAARVAGVAFSADPVSGRRAIAVVSAVRGLGQALVSGESDADTWLVDREGQIIERRIAGDGPALTDAEVVSVADLARRAARHFGTPQDIEWAMDETGLSLLQSRPITSLASVADPDGEIRVWDNSNIVESYSGVTTPLTFSFASEIYEHVYRQFCRIMRVPESAIDGHDEAFRNMLGLIRGRLYYNLINWYRVLALLPGFSINRRFMEQMMGVSEGLPPAIVRAIESDRTRGRFRDALHLASTVTGLLVQHLTIDRRVGAFYDRLKRALAPPAPPLADRSPDELIDHYRDLRAALLLRWDAPLVNDFFAMIFYGLLRKLTSSWCGDVEGTLQNDLVGGEGGLVSAEPAERLTRLASLARSTPELATALTSDTREEIESRLSAHPAFAAEYRAYLDKFGERSINELKLETETLHDDPLPLFRAIGAIAGHRGPSAPGFTLSGHARRAEAERRAGAALESRPLRQLVFRWVLRHARARVRDREDLRLERTRLFGRVRRIFVELGRRFHALGILAHPRDIFFLDIGEVFAYVEGRSTCASLAALAELRRREFEAYGLTPAPPNRFETRGPVHHGQRFASEVEGSGVAGDERRGQGCCPGVVRGPVRVVRDPLSIDIGQQSVLVAEHTDPGWILIFPAALAVLVERGSLLSHAAIVTRELGIPSVVSVPGVTRWLKDGDWVEVNGGTGVVRRIAAPATEAREHGGETN